ncbi:amidase signature domain-containing protein [Penicillium angulare]|uniref:Amidase signature domain-containing protein n=1 Tax=Penicillium angulare TaxID=116970 RepID=A0A9W9GDR8_9EURO|nr:amidase signature domain-containing protein [Penicillium angulare]
MHSSTRPLDVLVATSRDLQALLDDNTITSETLVEVYFDQIEKHNHHGLRLHAIISTAPRSEILAAARLLDEERKRSPLHGIPIVVKVRRRNFTSISDSWIGFKMLILSVQDNMCTPSLGMETTCGSYALVGAKAKKDAVVVERLKEAGALIIGKANMSASWKCLPIQEIKILIREWANFKQRMMTTGWSPVGGQTQSPYVRGGVLPNATSIGHSTPAGSSSGSAVAVAAGFAPISIATESDGSLVCPAGRAGVYGLKLTVGAVPYFGCQANSPWVAASGAMGKSTLDVADTVSIMLRQPDLPKQVKDNWGGLRLGFVDFHVWKPRAAVVEDNEGFYQQLDKLLEEAIQKIILDGATVVRDVELITPLETVAGTNLSDFGQLMIHQARDGFSAFMDNFEDTPVRSVEELVQFNKDNSAIELPHDHSGQELIIAAVEDTMTDEEFQSESRQVRETATKSVESTLEKYGVDVIIGSSDARIAGVAAAAGFPVENVPLGNADFNGRAISLSVLAPAGHELDILKVMRAWEVSLPNARGPPPLLVNWDSFVGGNLKL